MGKDYGSQKVPRNLFNSSSRVLTVWRIDCKILEIKGFRVKTGVLELFYFHFFGDC